MTLEELYRAIDGNYQSICERLRKEERIEKFVLLFLKDQSYSMFQEAIQAGHTENAFRAIHTLKGVCMNLSFDELYRFASEITEFLRADDLSHAMEILPDFVKCYEKHFQTISAYAKDSVTSEEK